MRAIPQKGGQKKNFFLEVRMPFLQMNSGQISQLSEDGDQKEKLAQIKTLLEQEGLNTAEKAFLRQEQKNPQLTEQEQEKIQELLQEDNEIILGNLDLPAGYLDPAQEQVFAGLSIAEAMALTRNADDLADLLGHLQWIVAYGKNDNKTVLRKNILKECTKDFAKKHKEKLADPEALKAWAKLAESMGVANANEIAEKIIKDRGDLNLAVNTAQENNTSVVLTEKYASDIRNLKKQGINPEIIKKLEQTLSSENEQEKQNNLQSLQNSLEQELANLIRQGVGAVNRELERLFGDPDTESGLVFSIIDIAYDDPNLANEIKANFKKQIRALRAQVEIIEKSEGKTKKAFQEIQEHGWGDPEEIADVEKIFTQIDKFKEKADDVRQKYNRAKRALAKIYHDINKVDGKSFDGKTILRADLADANFLKRQDVHEFFTDFNISPADQAKLIQALRTGEIYFSSTLLPETAQLADEFGVDEQKIAKLVQTSPKIDEELFLAKEKGFLEKTFDLKKAKTIQKTALYQDFFGKSGNKLDQGLQDILEQGKDLMSITFRSAEAPKDKEKLANNLQTSIDKQIATAQESGAILQERVNSLHSALAKNDLPNDTRAQIKKDLQETQKALANVPNEEDVAKFRTAGNEGLNMIDAGDPLHLTRLQGFSSWLQDSADDIKTANTRLSKNNVALGGAGTAEEVKKALKIGTEVNTITEELADIKADLIPKEAQLDQKTEKFLELKNLLIRLRNGEQINKEDLLSFKNPDDSPVFNIIADNEWKHEHLRGEITKKGSGYAIYLKESEITGGALAHEIAHAVDFFANEKANKKLMATIKDFPEFADWKKRFEAWKSTENTKRREQGFKTTKARFEREIFAHLLAKDFDGEIGKIAHEIDQKLAKAGISAENFLPTEDDLKSGLLEKFFQHGDMRSEAAEEIETGSTLDPKRVKKMRAMFTVKEKLIRNKLADIKKGKLSGKTEFTTGAEDIIANCKSFLENAKTEEELEAVIKKMEELNGKASEVLSISTEKSDIQPGYFKNLWDSTTFLSVRDLRRFWETYVEYTERRYNTNSKRRTGDAGCAMFNGINDDLAAEFGLLSQSAEKEEVSKYGEPLENMDGWQVYERIEQNGNNIDVLKACMRDLAKKGMIDWRNQIIKDAFMRCGAPVRFYPGDDLNIQVLKQKYQKACAAFWDNDEFRTLDRDNNSSYDSKKDGYDNEANLTNDLRGALANMLLEKRKLGDKARVDPMRYEKFVDYSIPMGKMLAEDVIYYIIMGVKEGILTPERALKLDNAYLNDLPIINYFTSYEPTMAEYQKWGSMFETENGKMPVTFRNWLNTNFMTSKRVLERTIKSSSQAKWDHDYAPMVASIGDSTSAKTITASDHGNPKFVPTFYPNAINGMLMHMTDVANHSHEMSKEDLTAWLARQTGYIATTDAILYGKIYKKGDYHQMSQSDINKTNRIPGYNGDTNKDALTTGEMSDRLRLILTNIDPEFFGTLFSVRDENAPDTQEKFEHLKNLLAGRLSYAVDPGRAEPQKLEDIFEILEPLTLAILQKNSTALNKTLEGAREVFKKDHGGNDAGEIVWNGD